MLLYLIFLFLFFSLFHVLMIVRNYFHISSILKKHERLKHDTR